MPEVVYIYSQNSAINFLKVIKDYQLETLWMNTNLMCIGEKASSILNEIKSENNLLQRIYFMVSDGEPADRLLEIGPIIDPENFLTVRSIKMYADGALGSRGAALLEKYDDYDGKGVFIFQEEETKPRLFKALIKGIQIGTHAIGDHGNRVVLDWYEEAFYKAKKNNPNLKSPRWRIEHSQNIGGNGNLLSVAKKLSGRFSMIVDGDDIFLPGKIQKVCDILSSNPEVNLVAHHMVLANSSINKFYCLDKPTLPDKFSMDFMVANYLAFVNS